MVTQTQKLLSREEYSRLQEEFARVVQKYVYIYGAVLVLCTIAGSFLVVEIGRIIGTSIVLVILGVAIPAIVGAKIVGRKRKESLTNLGLACPHCSRVPDSEGDFVNVVNTGNCWSCDGKILKEEEIIDLEKSRLESQFEQEKYQEQFSRIKSKHRKHTILLFITIIGAMLLAVLAHKNLSPVFITTTITIAMMSGFFLMLLTLRNWKCPRCKKPLGKYISVSHCPSCGVRLEGERESPLEFENRIQESQRGVYSEDSESDLVKEFNRRVENNKKANVSLIIIFSLVAITAMTFRDNKPLVIAFQAIWVLAILVYLWHAYYRSRCPSCKTRIRGDQNYCIRCGLGTK